jgi:site-specific recombinase XerD
MAAKYEFERWGPILDQYCLFLREAGSRPATVKNYRHDLMALIRWHTISGSKPFSLEVFDGHQQQLYRAFLHERYARSTANRRLSSMRSALRWAEHLERSDSTPTSEVLRNFREAPRSMARLQPLEQSEISRLITTVHSTGVLRDIAIFTLLLNTGIRISELIELRWTDISIPKGSASVRIKDSKTGKHKVIPLNTAARRAILALSREELGEPTGFVIQGRGGEMPRRTIEMRLKRYATLAGITRFTPLRLRHTFFKELSGGTDIPDVESLLQNTDPRLTLAYYAAQPENKVNLGLMMEMLSHKWQQKGGEMDNEPDLTDAAANTAPAPAESHWGSAALAKLAHKTDVRRTMVDENGSAPRIKRAGWFAAGAEMAQAMALVSDGAFTLYVYLCLHSNRSSGSCDISYNALALALRKSPRSIATYCHQLRQSSICEMEPAVNQHDSTKFRICDSFWPYTRKNVRQADKGASSYMESIRSFLGGRACVKCSFGAADRGVAAKLSIRNIPLIQVERGVVLGCSRKYISLLEATESGLIHSLAYFLDPIEEAGNNETPAGYWAYLHHKLNDLEAKWLAKSPADAKTASPKR